MKNKPLFFNLHLVFILLPIAHCLLPAFVYAQPAKTTNKPAAAKLPSIIKTIDIPWPANVAVDEKEDRIFVLTRDGANSAAIFVLNGRDNSIIKKVNIKEPFFQNTAGNGLAYNPDTKRLYAIVSPENRNGNGIVAVDAKSYKVLDTLNIPRNDHVVISINVSRRHNLIYTAAVTDPYIYVFNGGSNKLAEEIGYKGGGKSSAITESGDFLYIAGKNEFMKFNTKEKKVSASLPIFSISVPYIDEKNSLIFAATAYKLYVIDLNTFKIKDEREDVPFPPVHGASIALNPATNHLFVPIYGDSVSVIDVPSMKILTTIKVGRTVKSIAVNSQTNRVYVTLVNEENKVIVIQDR